jgi:hypothetical protein
MAGPLQRLLMENGELIDPHAIADQGVGGRVAIRMAKRHSRQHNVSIGDVELFVHDTPVLTPGLLWAGLEPVRSGDDHHVLHEHPAVEPGTVKKAFLHGEEQANRRAERIRNCVA